MSAQLDGMECPVVPDIAKIENGSFEELVHLSDDNRRFLDEKFDELNEYVAEKLKLRKKNLDVKDVLGSLKAQFNEFKFLFFRQNNIFSVMKESYLKLVAKCRQDSQAMRDQNNALESLNSTIVNLMRNIATLEQEKMK